TLSRLLTAALFSALGAGVVVACASFRSDDTPGADADSVDAPAADAPAADAPPPDGTAADASAPSCDSDAWVLCDEFDDPARSPWGDPIVDDAGSLVISDAQSHTPPASLLARMAMVPNDASCEYAYLEHDFPAPLTATVAHVEGAVLPIELPTNDV